MQLTHHEVRILHGLAASMRALAYRYALDIMLGDPTTDSELTRLEQFGYITASPDDERQTLILTPKGWDHVTKDPSDQFMKVGTVNIELTTRDEAVVQWEPGQPLPEGTELYARVAKGTPGQAIIPVKATTPVVEMTLMEMPMINTTGFGVVRLAGADKVTVGNIVYTGSDAMAIRSWALNVEEEIVITSHWMQLLASSFEELGYLTKEVLDTGWYKIKFTPKGVDVLSRIESQ